MTSASTSARFSPGFVALLGFIAALGAVSMDMYLPSLPAVAEDLDTTAAAVQFTISGVLIGGAVGQLLMGPLSDRYGRRRPAMFGIGLHIVASLACMVAPSIEVLIAMRMLQGIGNSAATVTAMAVIRDRLIGGAAARVLSRLMLVIGVAPLLAPTVGGLIAGVWGWRAVFAALALFGVVLGIAVHRLLPETLSPEHRASSGMTNVARGYWSVLRDRQFMALALLPALGMSTILSYVSGAPFVLQLQFGLSAQQFALVFAANGLGGIVMSQVNASLVHRFEPLAILRVAVPGVFSLALVLLGVAFFEVGGLAVLLVVLWLLMSSVMFIPANATALALSRHGERAGTAAAMLGAMQAGMAGVVSPLVGVLGSDAVAMAIVLTGVLAAALVVLTVATPAYRR
ncbi:MAG: multidrug effflux MFS transporter [Actinomycetota bacterium]